MAVKKLYNIVIGGNTYAIPSASASQSGLMSADHFSKLEGIAEGAQANVLESVKVNGTALAIANKAVDILIAEGQTNGSISVNSVDVVVKGLAALAFKAEVSKDDLAAALKSELEGKLNANDAAYTGALANIEKLMGGKDVEGSIDNKIDAAFKAFEELMSDDDAVNTFKELVQWVAAHGTEAAGFASAISKLEGYMAGIGGEDQPATVMAAINAAIAALNIGNYYSKTEADGKFVAKADGYSLMEDSWKSGVDTKLNGIDANANKTCYSYDEESGSLTLSGIAEA